MEKRKAFNQNIELEWVAPHGPHKGEKVTSWFNTEDPEVDRLIKEYNAKIISTT